MSLPVQRLDFGEWLPDQPPNHNLGALEARNVVPLVNSYGALKGLSPFTDALDNPALATFWAVDSGGDIHNFAADKTKLYKLGGTNNDTWSDVSDSRGYASSESWEFEKFGDRVIATNGLDEPQYFDLNDSTTFLDLPNGPIGKHIAVVRDFIVMGDLDDAPSSIRWSGFNSSELWEPSRATQADIQQLFGRGGDVQRIVPGQYGVIFQEHSIYRMDYAGAGITFSLNEISRGRGTPAPQSVCWLGNDIFYYGYDDFYRFDGQESYPLGINRVARWAKGKIDEAAYSSMHGVVNRRNNTVMWTFKSSALLDSNNMVLIYNWGADKWSYAELDTQVLGEFVSPSVSLDSDAFNALYGDDIDGTNQRPFDDPIYAGNRLNIIAFDADNKGATFSGVALPAVLDTREVGGSGMQVVINNIRPEVDGVDVEANVQIGYRDSQLYTPMFTNPRAVNKHGEANLRRRARYARVRVNINSDFNHAQGVLVEMREGGRR